MAISVYFLALFLVDRRVGPDAAGGSAASPTFFDAILFDLVVV